MFSKLALFAKLAGAKPCSSPDTWSESCGTNQEMAQAQALYKHAPKDAWSATGGMPVVAGTSRAAMHSSGMWSKADA